MAVGCGDDAVTWPRRRRRHRRGARRARWRRSRWIVQHDREPVAELAEQDGGVETSGVGDDLDDPPVAHLETVAERTVDDVTTPLFGEPVDIRELVDQAGRRQHPTGDERVAAHELDAEAVVVSASDAGRAAGEDLAAVAPNLLAADGGEIRREGDLRGRESCACVRRGRCVARRRRRRSPNGAGDRAAGRRRDRRPNLR